MEGTEESPSQEPRQLVTDFRPASQGPAAMMVPNAGGCPRGGPVKCPKRKQKATAPITDTCT